MHVRACSIVYLGKYFLFLQISEFTLKKQPNNPLLLPRPQEILAKLQINLKTIASGEIYVESILFTAVPFTLANKEWRYATTLCKLDVEKRTGKGREGKRKARRRKEESVKGKACHGC